VTWDLLPYAVGQLPSYEPAAHLCFLAEKLEAVARGECKRLMIFMPPRHGKSMLASQFFPAWWMGMNPEKYIIAASHTQGLADDFGRKVRNLMADPRHEAMFPGSSVSGDSHAMARFHTAKGGTYLGVGVGVAIAGRGAHLLLIDDPIKSREDAESDTMRARLKSWYQSDAYTRLMPGASVVVIQTRWHPDDLAGWLLADHQHEGWEVVNLPALAEQDDQLGRDEGQPLWPEQFGEEALQRLRLAVGSRDWNALYQQRPAALEGGLFKLDWFKRYGTAPAKFQRIIQSWDTGMKAAEVNDPSVCTTWGETETGYYLLDVLRRRMEYPELRRMAQSLAEKWHPHSVLIEDKASGQSLLQELRANTKLPVLGIEPKGDKVVRSQSVSPLVEAGKVYLPEVAPWLPDLEAGLLNFPNVAHDDQVDSMTQALSYLSGASGESMGIFEFYRRKAEALKREREA